MSALMRLNSGLSQKSNYKATSLNFIPEELDFYYLILCIALYTYYLSGYCKNITSGGLGAKVNDLGDANHKSSYFYENLPVPTRRPILLGIFLYDQSLHLTHINLHPNTQLLSTQQHAYQSFLATSWFDSVCSTMAIWLNLKEKTFT